jgi:ankyrin repeat protein
MANKNLFFLIIALVVSYGCCLSGMEPEGEESQSESDGNSLSESDGNSLHERTLLQASALGDLNSVRIALGLGASLEVRDEKYSGTPLWWAATNGHLEVVRELLTLGADPNAQNIYGETALHRAAYADHREVVKELINHKANINTPAEKGLTPLDYAASKNFSEVGHLLIQNGAVAHTVKLGPIFPGQYLLLAIAERRKENALYYIRVTKDPAKLAQALVYAAAQGQPDIIDHIMAHALAREIPAESFIQAATSARRAGHEDIARRLERRLFERGPIIAPMPSFFGIGLINAHYHPS